MSDTLNTSPLDLALEELREYIEKIQRPRPADSKWSQRMRQAGKELADKFAALGAKSEEKQAALRDSFRMLAERLHAYSTALAERPDMKALKERCDALMRGYEELLLELRAKHVARAAALTQSRQLKPVNYARNLFHASNATIAVVLYHFVLTKEQALWVLGTIFGVFAFLEITRRLSDRWNDFLVDKVFGAISRPSERYRTNSATLYLLALIIITWSFEKLPVEAAILVLGYGDPMASLIGKRFGKKKLFRDKSYAGTLGFFGAAFVVVLALILISAPDISALRMLFAAAGIALVGAVTELLSSRIDDNFSIPVVCAVAASLLL